MIFRRILPEIKKKSSDKSRRENQITNFALNTFFVNKSCPRGDYKRYEKPRQAVHHQRQRGTKKIRSACQANKQKSEEK